MKRSAGKAAGTANRMAIYHVHVSSGSRADGQSAALKVSYILREGPHGGHDDLVEWGAGHMPAWAIEDPRRLFVAADVYERKDGRLYLHVWVALPNELNEEQRHDLVLAIGATLTASGLKHEHGLPYVYAVHAGDPKSPCETANPHVHYVCSERVNDGIARAEERWFRRGNRRDPAAGGAPKDRTLKEVTWVADARKAIERVINEHLAWAGREERVTADSHAVRIVEAEARGDTEAAEHLRRHPPGIHLGPAAAAIERDRFRGKEGEEPELARAGEPTERGELARARKAEEERARRDLARVSEQLRRARAEERRAKESVAAARAALLTDQEIVGAYEEAELIAAGSGWEAVAGAATSQAGRKEEAEAAAGRLAIDVEAVYRNAEGENGVARLKEVVGIFEQAQAALLTVAEIETIREEAESSEAGAGWRAVAAGARTQSAWKERAEGAAREAGIEDLDDVYAAARARDEHPLSALEWATATVEQARSALMTEEEIEAVRDGSGWPALESAAASRLDWKTEAENAARGEGLIDIEREYASAQERKADPLARLVAVTDVVVRAREAFLTDDAIRALHAAGDSRERGRGWTAVEEAAAAAGSHRMRTEASAREAGIVDIDAVYAAARSRAEDPLAALEEAIAAQRRAERREAGLRGLQRRPGGREMTVAHLAALVPAGQEPAEEQVDEALTAAESDAERLARAGRIHGDRWSRLLYVAAVGVLGERFTLPQVDAAMTDAERFAERACGLSQAGRETFETAVEECGEHPAVDELVAALERAQEAERQEEEQQRAEEQRRTRVARQETDVRATKRGPGWLREAAERVLQGADRTLTLEERERIVEMVSGRIRTDLDRRQKELRSTERGAGFLDEAQRSAGPVTTLVAEEQCVEAGEKQVEEQQQRELDRREAQVRATSAGEQRLKKEQSRIGATRSLTLDEKLSVVETVEKEIGQELDAREEAIRAEAGEGDLLQRVEGRRSAPRDLGEREQKVEAVERVFQAADEVETQVLTTPHPKQRGCRVPVVFDALLDAVLANDDDLFVGDVVFVLRARYAQRTLKSVAEGGYDAAAREASARRHFGSAVVDAMKWCVLKVREIILAACHKILGGGGESGERVQASLEAARAERQAQQSAVESAAQQVGIDVDAFSQDARENGRDPVAALELLSNAAAVGVDVEGEFEVGGFLAIVSATEQRQRAISAAQHLRIDVDAVYAAARSKGEDPHAALKKETAWARTVRSYAAAIGFSRRSFEAVFAAGTRQSGSGYTAVWEECVRTTAREEVRKVLPFEAPNRARPGDRKLAVSGEPAEILLRLVEGDDEFAQDILREVMAEAAGSDEERATAEDFYHLRQTRIEHKKQKREQGWLSSEPTQEEAKQAVLDRFIPTLAGRVRQACAQVQDLEGWTARIVEEDRVRRVKGALEKTLSQETPYGYGSRSIAVSDERFSRIAERTRNASVQEFISTTYLEGLSRDDHGRAQAEEKHLSSRIREKEESGLRRDQAEAAAREEYAAEVQHHIERIFRETESRSVEEILRERERRDSMPDARLGYGVDRTDEHGQKRTEEGWEQVVTCRSHHAGRRAAGPALGRRVLILGNHDLEAGFAVQHVAPLCATDPPLALTHMPLRRVAPAGRQRAWPQ